MTRRLLVAAGIGTLAFGVEQLLTSGAPAEVLSALLWLGAAVVVHDGVVAPLAAGAGHLVGRGGRLVGAGLAVAAVLTLLALPALLGPGVPDNPTVLPRDTGHGLALLLAADAGLVAVLALARHLRRRRAGRRGRPDAPTPAPAGRAASAAGDAPAARG